jgi:hypothetical protein
MKPVTMFSCLLMLFVAGTASAAGGWNTNNIHISNIEFGPSAGGSPDLYLAFDAVPNGTNKPSCATGNWVKIDGNADMIKALSAAATAAMLSNKSLRIYWKSNASPSGCDATYTTYGLISRLEIIQ